MADNGTSQPNKTTGKLSQVDLASLQDFLLDGPPSTASSRPQDMSVAELEVLLAQKRLEEARRNHRKLLSRPASPEPPPATPVSSAQPARSVSVRPPDRLAPPDQVLPTRFEPARLVTERPGRRPHSRPALSWLNWLGYGLETIVIVAVLFLLGNWVLQQAGISFSLFGPVSVADISVAPLRPDGILLKAQAGGTIQLPATPTPHPPTPTLVPLNPAVTAGPTLAPRPTPTLPPLAVAPTPTPAIVQPVLQNVANGAALPPRPPRRLIVPRLGIDSPVEEVTVNLGNWQVADNVVGHHLGTATPGQPGNMVLAGHRDIRGSIFLRLNELQTGDEFKVVSDNGIFQYQVTQIEEVPPTEVSVMSPTIDPTATLITCTPVGLATRRLIVRARLEK